MKVKEDFLLREVAGCYVVVPVGKATVDFNGMVNLNETGAFLWKRLQEDTTKEALVDAIVKEYDVAGDVALKDVEAYLNTLQESGLIE